MSDLVQSNQYKELGLNDNEAALAASWNGGVDRNVLQRAEILFVEGISIESIHENFPEFPVEMLQQGRALFGWDKLRQEKLQRTAQESISSGSQPEALGLANIIIKGLNKKYGRLMQIYITDPYRTDFPTMTRADLELWKLAVEISREIMGLNNKAKDAPGVGGMGTSPMVAINIVQGTPRQDQPHVIDITPDRAIEIEKALFAKAGMIPPDEDKK